MIDVIKIGGNIIDDPDALDAFLQRFAAMPGKCILVHGGGREATRLCARTGITTKMVDGRRVTDTDTLRIVTMVYAGLINKRVVSMLQKHGCNAAGLSGADANLIPASRRPALPVDFGHVGDIDPAKVNDGFLRLLLDAAIAPVICAICHDTRGNLLNCNADSVAKAVAVAASRIDTVRLTYCFEMDGVMADINDPASIISVITPRVFEKLKADGSVSGGMLPKLSNALDGVRNGIAEVRICRATAIGTAAGTSIRLQ